MIIIIIILLLIIALEVFLSLQDNKYLGMILPVATILLALTVFFGKMINTSILIAAFAFLLFSVWLIVKHILKIKKRKKIDMMKINDL